MPTLYSARWVLPIGSSAIRDAALVVDGDRIIAVGARVELGQQFPDAAVRDLGEAAIVPGLVNAHSHLELTCMRGFLDAEESNFFAWLRKLTTTRAKMTAEDLYFSAAWGVSEALRAGVTCVGDASDSAYESMSALRDAGMRGVVFQESFGPDPRLAAENFEALKAKVVRLRERETDLVKCGVSPHAPYTVSAPQLEMIARFALAENLPVMMHAAETIMETSLLSQGSGPFAEGLANRGIEWDAPGLSTIQYLDAHDILQTHPLLAHCINVDEADIRTLRDTGSSVAHCPKSNAKLGHGIAPLAAFVHGGVTVGFGSDSVASNNSCDILEEARFALLTARQRSAVTNPLCASKALEIATLGGARALGLEGVVGELREGLQADFAVVSINRTHQVPFYEPVSTLIFNSSGRDVVLTVVAGREVYRHGRVTTLDEDLLREKMKDIAAKLEAG